MKFPSKNILLTAVSSLFLGILLGSQVPGLIERYNLWQGEKQAFEQLENSVNKADSWVLISQYRYRRGDKKGSIEAAHKALEFDPHHVVALEKIAFNYLEMGDLENSKIWLEKSLKEAEIYAPGQVEILKVSLTQVRNQMKP
jgi:tetratricopeptide (TPR) repeat protein